MDCIFCKIVAGTVPCFKVYESTSVLAFMDINPLSEGHVLVIPKMHAANVWEIDETSIRDTAAAARMVSLGMRKVLSLDSMSLIQSNGTGALQSVDHFHFHLVPRKVGDDIPWDWPLNPGNRDKIKATADKIALALKA